MSLHIVCVERRQGVLVGEDSINLELMFDTLQARDDVQCILNPATNAINDNCPGKSSARSLSQVGILIAKTCCRLRNSLQDVQQQ